MRIAVLGGGHSGLTMAGHLALNGISVTLWNRTPEHIAQLLSDHVIHCDGVFSGDAVIETVTSDITQAIADVDMIMVTTPANAHNDIAAAIAPYLTGDTIIILNPGRTFGAVNFHRALQENGCQANPRIAETQTIIYTCRRKDDCSVSTFAYKHDVLLAALARENTTTIINALPDCLRPFFRATASMIETSLGNVGMILHCAPVLMNIGWIENVKTNFKYYYEGITPSIAAFVEKMDHERQQIGEGLGVHLESVSEWMQRSYDVTGSNLYECLCNNSSYATIDAPNSIHHRYLYEDVPCGLVPTEQLGKLTGVATPCISLIISIAEQVLDTDFRKDGRKITLEELHGITDGVYY